MKMKKILAAALASCTLLAAFTSCSATGNSTGSETSGGSLSAPDSHEEKDVNLVVTWWGNQTRNDRTQTVIDMYMEENPNVTIDGQFFEYGDYWTKMSANAAANMLPDIIQDNAITFMPYVEAGQLLDLTPYTEDGTIDISNVSPELLEQGKVDGKLYAIPLGVNSAGLVYNKTLLDENGIVVKDLMNLEEYAALCKEVYEKTGYKTDLWSAVFNNFAYIVRGTTGNPLYTTEGRLGVDSPEDVADYFTLAAKGIAEGWALPMTAFAERTDDSIEQLPLVYGSSAADRSWCATIATNQLISAQDAIGEETELAITSSPSRNPKTSMSLSAGTWFSISANSQNIEEACAFVDYFTNSIEANKVLLAERGIPASSVVADAIFEDLDAGTAQVVEFINNVVTPNSSAPDAAVPAYGPQITDLVSQIMEQVLTGNISGEKAAEEFISQATIIANTD